MLALALARRYVPEDVPPGTDHRLDTTGLLLLSPGLAALVYGLSRDGLTRDTAIPAGALLVVLFAAHALRSPAPLVDLRLFQDRAFAVSSTLMFLNGLALYGGMFLLPLYYQQARGESVVAAGLLLAPQGLGSLLSRATGPLTDRVGPRPVVLTGLLLSALGTLPFALHHPAAALLPLAFVVRGLAVNVGAHQGLSPDRIPHGSTTVRIVQQLGGSVGTAVLAAVLARGRGAAAFPHAFLWSTAFTVLAALVALALPAQVAAPERPS
ncbi:MFS transporter [Streptomyces sp. NBC_00019]